MVQALRQCTTPRQLRFDVPDGGLYLWCQLADGILARALHRHTKRDRIVFVPGEAFYVDRGGSHELRICFTSQVADRAMQAARSTARGIARLEKLEEPARPLLLPIA
jgi:2-aminoadipate transaminase